MNMEVAGVCFKVMVGFRKTIMTFCCDGWFACRYSNIKQESQPLFYYFGYRIDIRLNKYTGLYNPVNYCW
jgi:hypothetical protein